MVWNLGNGNDFLKDTGKGYSNMTNVSGNMNVEIETSKTWAFEKKSFFYLLAGALEGGSNYWIERASFKPPESDEDKALMEKAADDIFKGLIAPLYGGDLMIEICRDFEGDVLPRYNRSLGKYENVESSENVMWSVGEEELRRGVQAMAKKYPRHFDDLVRKNEDANTSDCFLQCCCFGEMVYG